jgi:predicted  nucleic acid-binding Zn-ribbon protein
MARIEIPMEEYNGMKERIESLEMAIVEKDKKIDNLKNDNLKLQTTLEDVSEMALIDRIFKWKATFNTIVGDEE